MFVEHYEDSRPILKDVCVCMCKWGEKLDVKMQPIRLEWHF